MSKEISKYLNQNFSNKGTNETKNDMNYYKLPYIGTFSKSTQKSISELCNKYCKELKIRLSFTPFKIGSLFSLKDKISMEHKSFVVYLFICSGCNARYIGETTKQFMVRVNEHLHTDKGSSINKHLKSNTQCKCDKSNFKIIDQANSKFTLKIKEAIHIEWQKPDLNKQVKHVRLNILV